MKEIKVEGLPFVNKVCLREVEVSTYLCICEQVLFHMNPNTEYERFTQEIYQQLVNLDVVRTTTV